MSNANTTNETTSQREAPLFSTSVWVFGSLLLSLAVVLVCAAFSTSPTYRQSFPNLFGPALVAWCVYLLLGSLMLGLQASRTRVRDGIRLLVAGMPLYVLMVWCGFSLNARIGVPHPAESPAQSSAPVEIPPYLTLDIPPVRLDEPADTNPVEEVDQFLARLHTPTPLILKLAAQITDVHSYNPRAAALRAIAERRFEDAENYLCSLEIQESDNSSGGNLSSVAQLRAELAFYAGRYAEAIHQYRLALKDDSDNPLLLNGLANSLEVYGQYREAEAAYKQAIKQAKSSWGSDDQDTLSFIAGLGGLYDEMERYAESQVLLEQALEGRERTLDSNDPDVALSLNALANLYERTNRYDEAETLYQRALAIQEKALGVDFPDTASTRENLGVLYNDLGRHEEAERLCRQATKVLEAYYGEEHPDLAYSYTNLGVIHHDLNDYAESERMYRKALEVDKRSLASNAPNLATDYHNLGVLYDNQSRYAEAEAAYKRALALYEQSLGVDSPSLLTTLDCLANMYNLQDRPLAALALYRRVLAITEKASVRNSADLISALDNCANTLYRLGRDTEAEQMEARSQHLSPTPEDNP